MPTPNEDGIDISHWNVVTDESAIPPYPLMSAKATEGKQFVSPKFRDYWQMFARLGARYRGAYHWVRSDSTMTAQVDHLAKTLDSVGGLLAGDFVQLDWETTANVPNVTAGQIEEWVHHASRRFGDRIIVYGAPWVPGFVEWRHRNPTVPVWLANYNTALGPKGGWLNSSHYDAAVWQWSSTWKVPGFLWNPDNPDDGIDINHVFDWATLDRLTLQHADPPPPPPDEEDDVLEYVLIPTHPDAEAWWPWLACYSSGTVRPLGPGPAAVPQHQVTDIGQYRRICSWAGIQLETELPKCAEDSDVTVEVEGVPFEFPVLKATTTIGPA